MIVAAGPGLPDTATEPEVVTVVEDDDDDDDEASSEDDSFL
jgi:hypothetical protein